MSNTVLEKGYENYNGFYIYEGTKMVFGKKRIMFAVESFDTIIFRSSSLEKCHQFCDDFFNDVLTKI